MQYNDVTLLFLGIAGILFHCLLKIMQLKKTNTFTPKMYLNAEWPNMVFSLIAVIVAIVLKHEITKLQEAGDYLGFAFVAIGYMAQSVLVTVMGKAQKIIGVDNTTPGASVILILLLPLLMASCANEKKFVRFHDKCVVKGRDSIVAKHCAAWYPPKDSIHESVYYTPGETQYIQGETIYANCDSAYRDALDSAAKYGTKLIIKKVAIPCPPSTVRIDTVHDNKITYVENTAKVDMLTDQLAARTAMELKFGAAYVKWKKRALCGWGVILALVVGTGVHWYFKSKGKAIQAIDKIV